MIKSEFKSGVKFSVLTYSYINTALSQSAFRIYTRYIIIIIYIPSTRGIRRYITWKIIFPSSFALGKYHLSCNISPYPPRSGYIHDKYCICIWYCIVYTAISIKVVSDNINNSLVGSQRYKLVSYLHLKD